MSVAPASISNTNSFALTTGLQRRAWKRPTCTRTKRCSGAYGVDGMQALGPLDQWQGRGRIKQAQTRPNRLVAQPADRRRQGTDIDYLPNAWVASLIVCWRIAFSFWYCSGVRIALICGSVC